MAILSNSLFIALVAFVVQIHPTTAAPGQLTSRQTACAVLPGNPSIVRSVSFPLDTRQTATSTVSMAQLLAQSSPCFPPSMDISGITSSVSTAQSTGRATAQGLFSFLKDVWQDVLDVVKVVTDVEAVLEYADVADIFQLAIDGYKLYNDVTKTIIGATSPDGSTTVTWQPVVPYVRRPPVTCGYSTGKECP